jgi:SAM-dependent methyltransferase
MDLKWRDRWDIVFLLDVIEHIPDDIAALQEVARVLRSNGKIILTVPALDFFWSHNDEAAKHLRRYSKKDLQELADKAGLRLVNSSYFMFFLSPLYWLSRIRVGKNASIEEKKEAIQREHKIPFGVLNFILGVIFKAETPISKIISFPWGTSVLGVFEKVPLNSND